MKKRNEKAHAAPKVAVNFRGVPVWVIAKIGFSAYNADEWLPADAAWMTGHLQGKNDFE